MLKVINKNVDIMFCTSIIETDIDLNKTEAKITSIRITFQYVNLKIKFKNH
jgi:hypothetical protein